MSMTSVMASDKFVFHQQKVDRSRVMEDYKDFFKDHGSGIFTEGYQNGIDAYDVGTPMSDVRIEFKYSSKNRTLVYQDHNTLGMFHCSNCEWGEIDGGDDTCTDDECRWGGYHNLHCSVKQREDNLGTRGLGKSLQILSGKETLVQTSLPNGKCMASLWRQSEKGWEWQNRPDLSESFPSSGTRVTTTGVIDKVHRKLIDREKIIEEIRFKWFTVINAGAHISYSINGKNSNKIEVLEFPDYKDSLNIVGPIPIYITERNNDGKPKKVKGRNKKKKVGNIFNLSLFYAKQPLKKDDKRIGVIMIKNGKQSIMNHEFQDVVSVKIKNRIFGWVDVGKFLSDEENPSHTEYNGEMSNEVASVINSHIRDFIKPYMPKSEIEKQTKESTKLTLKFQEVLNDDDFKDLRTEYEDGTVSPPKPKTHPYIVKLSPSNKSFTKGETIEIEVKVKNPLETSQIINTRVEFTSPEGKLIESIQKNSRIDNDKCNKIESSIYIENSFISGTYMIRVSLRDREGKPILRINGREEIKGAFIYIDKPNRKLSRNPGGKSEGEINLKHGYDIKSLGDLGIEIPLVDMYAMWTKGKTTFNYNPHGSRYSFINEKQTRKGAKELIIVELVLDEIISHKMKDQIVKDKLWDSTLLKKEINKFQKLKSGFINKFLEGC